MSRLTNLRLLPANQLSDQDIALRWKQVTPHLFRYLAIFIALSVGLYAVSRGVPLSQGMKYLVNAGLQITCALSVYYAVVGMVAVFQMRKQAIQPQSIS